MPDEACVASPETNVAASPIPPGLVIVATPIGNLGDLSARAVAALGQADLILCEDTRVTARLLAHTGLHTRMQALHDYNEEARVPGVLARLRAGARIALVSDAGMPLVSDPGTGWCARPSRTVCRSAQFRGRMRRCWR